MPSQSHPSDWPKWAQSIPSESGEFVLELGGTHVMAYYFTFLFSLACSPTYVGPLLIIWFFWGRSGRFLLTSHRLIWNPHIGKKVIIPRAELRDLKIHIGTRLKTVKLRGARKLTMPFQWCFKELWGGLLLLQRWQPPAATASSPAFNIYSGELVSGARYQRGSVAVLGSTAHFLPDEPMANVAAQAGAAMAGLVLGVTYRTHRAQLPIFQALRLVARARPFQSELETLQRVVGGETLQGPPTKKGPAGKGRTRMTYEQGERQISFTVSED